MSWEVDFSAEGVFAVCSQTYWTKWERIPPKIRSSQSEHIFIEFSGRAVILFPLYFLPTFSQLSRNNYSTIFQNLQNRNGRTGANWIWKMMKNKESWGYTWAFKVTFLVRLSAIFFMPSVCIYMRRWLSHLCLHNEDLSVKKVGIDFSRQLFYRVIKAIVPP